MLSLTPGRTFPSSVMTASVTLMPSVASAASSSLSTYRGPLALQTGQLNSAVMSGMVAAVSTRPRETLEKFFIRRKVWKERDCTALLMSKVCRCEQARVLTGTCCLAREMGQRRERVGEGEGRGRTEVSREEGWSREGL